MAFCVSRNESSDRLLGKARPLTPDDGHEGSTLDGKRAHALRLGNDTGDTQTPPRSAMWPPSMARSVSWPRRRTTPPTEPLDPLPKPKPRAAATLAGGGGSGVDAKGIELLKSGLGKRRSPTERW